MHGDKDSPDDVVLTKEDYQNYDSTRGVFTKLLSVELIRRTFLFIGFSGIVICHYMSCFCIY